MKDVDKIDIYNNSAIILDKKTPKRIISWITILIIFLVMFLICSFIHFNIYKPYIGVIENVGDDVYFVSELEYSDFPVSKDNKLYVKNKQYNYEIVSIKDNVLTLKIDLDDNLKIQNNILVINILKDRTTIFKIIIKKLKKGFGL